MRTPMISVVMPVYNGEKYLREAIESILEQTYRDFEFIILNDGSTDRTEEIILSYNDPRIVYVKNEENLGIVRTLNKGISLAKGKYIARMDADDISLPERFEKQIRLFHNEPHVSAVFSTVLLIDEQSENMGQWDDDVKCVNLEDFLNILPKKNCFAHPTLLIKKNVIQRFMYDKHAIDAEDYNLWLKLISTNEIIKKISEPLLRYRVHARSITQLSQTSHTKSIQKNIRAKQQHLRYKAGHLSFNSFDKSVFFCLLRYDYVNLLKGLIKEPLRNACMKIGMMLWKIYPKHIDTDIFFIFPSAGMGGAERVHLEILKASKKYKTFTLITKRASNKYFLGDYCKESKVFNVSWVNYSKIFEWIAAGYLVRLAESSSIKIIFGSISGIFYDIASSINKQEIKFIDLFHAKDGNLEYYALRAIPRINKQIFIDKETMHSLKHLYQKNGYDFSEKLQLIQNGVFIPKYSKSYFKKTDEAKNLQILFVGRDAPVKRIYLIREIASHCPSFNFVLVGVDTDSDDPPNLIAVGRQNNTEKYYQEADILLITSEREGFPMAVMEAMAYGVIPICTDVGGIKTHITNRENGYLVPVQSEEEIIQYIVSLLQTISMDHSIRERLSLNAYNYAKNNFSIKNFYQAYRRLFDDILMKETHDTND